MYGHGDERNRTWGRRDGSTVVESTECSGRDLGLVPSNDAVALDCL